MGVLFRILPALICLLFSQVAVAKPTILVKVTIDERDSNLRMKLARDLNPRKDRMRTPEQFLIDILIDEFGVLEMFQFVATVPSPHHILNVFVSSGNDRQRYPARDVDMVISLTSDPHEIRVPLFRRAGCSINQYNDCAPETLADSTWYRTRLRNLLRQWPSGLFRGIVLSSDAKYEIGGIVRTKEEIDEFGQRHGGPPTALFEISFGEVQRLFAFCMKTPNSNWKALGRDQTNQIEVLRVPTCYVPHSKDVRSTEHGTVTLIRAFIP